jgi:hypothetical protein
MLLPLFINSVLLVSFRENSLIEVALPAVLSRRFAVLLWFAAIGPVDGPGKLPDPTAGMITGYHRGGRRIARES